MKTAHPVISFEFRGSFHQKAKQIRIGTLFSKSHLQFYEQESPDHEWAGEYRIIMKQSYQELKLK